MYQSKESVWYGEKTERNHISNLMHVTIGKINAVEGQYRSKAAKRLAQTEWYFKGKVRVFTHL